jgi:hypothetical protein
MDIALRDLDALPPVTDGAHSVVRIDVSDDGPRFCLTFCCLSGRSLRVCLPAEHLRALADVLLELATARVWRENVHESEVVR